MPPESTSDDKRKPDIGTSYEIPLIFSEVLMGFLFTFYLNLDDKYLTADGDCISLNVKEVTRSLKEKFGKYTGELIKGWDCKNDKAEWNTSHYNILDVNRGLILRDDIHNLMNDLMNDEKNIIDFTYKVIPYAREFESIEKFFSDSKNIFAKHFRFALGEMFIKGSDFEKNCISPFCYVKKLELFLNIYPKAKEAILYFTLKLKDNCNCNDIILLRQHFMEKRHDIRGSIPNSPDEWFSKSDFTPEKYIDLIRDTLGKNDTKSEIKDITTHIVKTNIIEVRELRSCVCTSDWNKKRFWGSMPVCADSLKRWNPNSNLSSYVNIDDCAKNLILEYPQQIYSLLVGDEGWKFVPQEVALSRIKENVWSTRGFFSVFTIGNSVLLFNFKSADRYKMYHKFQKRLSEHYKQDTDPYFELYYNIPGVEHGPLFWLELISIIKLYSDNILKGLTDVDKYYDFLSEFKIKEQAPISILNLITGEAKVEKILLARNVISSSILHIDEINKKWEVGQLGDLINKSLLIPNNINKLELMLDSAENKLSLEYQVLNNKLMVALTIVATALTLMGLIKELIAKL